MLSLVAQSCPTLANPWTVSRQAPLSVRILQARILEWAAMPMPCHAREDPLQGIFPTQGSTPGLPQRRQILYHLSHQGSPDKGPTTCLREFSVDKTVWFHVSSSHSLGAAREQVAG